MQGFLTFDNLGAPRLRPEQATYLFNCCKAVECPIGSGHGGDRKDVWAQMLMLVRESFESTLMAMQRCIGDSAMQ
eukprot:scaffold166410_cov37-Tisochrysis_lutea.AAC.1